MKSARHRVILFLLALVVAARPGNSAAFEGKQAPVQLIWQNPGAVESLDFVGGPGGRSGAPKPPFRFIEEDASGTSPKVKVKDARGAVWSVKWGEEVNSDAFASRIAWASGYFVQPVHFVPRGKIRGATGLKRAKDLIGKDGSFTAARFQLRDPRVKFLSNEDWTWSLNPFVGTRELNGLKIVMMLTSNWDNKDARDADRGSNTGILQDTVQGRTRLRYFVADWGGSMGKWGNVIGREKWDSAGYAAQTPEFIEEVKDGIVKWGYHGQRTSDATQDIHVSDLRWILKYVGRITDAQLRAGLRASGATPAEVNTFTGAMRARINQMRSAARPQPLPKAALNSRR
ncbi:MAG: hypothetical protein ABI972_16935 [Acidobacteriota bacterium]